MNEEQRKILLDPTNIKDAAQRVYDEITKEIEEREQALLKVRDDIDLRFALCNDFPVKQIQLSQEHWVMLRKNLYIVRKM